MHKNNWRYQSVTSIKKSHEKNTAACMFTSGENVNGKAGSLHVLASCVSNTFETFTENCIRSMKYAAEPALFFLNLIFCDPFWILSYHKRRLRVGAVLQDVTHFHFRFIALVWVGNFLIAFRRSYWVLGLSFVRSKRQFGLYRGKNWFWKYENQ